MTQESQAAAVDGTSAQLAQPDNAQNSSGKAPCRRRCPKSHQAILTAAVELLEEKGYAGVTIEAIAARASVGKQTIYRWWSSKADVILEAYTAQATKLVSTPDTGSVRADLLLLLQQVCDRLTSTAGMVVAGLIAEAQHEPKLAEAFRNQFIASRRAATQTILQRGIERGELRQNLDLEVAIDLLYGAIWYRLLLKHAPLEGGFVKELIEQLLTGMQL